MWTKNVTRTKPECIDYFLHTQTCSTITMYCKCNTYILSDNLQLNIPTKENIEIIWLRNLMSSITSRFSGKTFFNVGYLLKRVLISRAMAVQPCSVSIIFLLINNKHKITIINVSAAPYNVLILLGILYIMLVNIVLPSVNQPFICIRSMCVVIYACHLQLNIIIIQ